MVAATPSRKLLGRHDKSKKQKQRRLGLNSNRVVVMDIITSDINGIEVAYKTRMRVPETGIILISSTIHAKKPPHSHLYLVIGISSQNPKQARN